MSVNLYDRFRTKDGREWVVIFRQGQKLILISADEKVRAHTDTSALARFYERVEPVSSSQQEKAK